METHLEIETKFDVDTGFVLPSLAALDGVASVEGPVEERLDAEYFDTSDLRLLRAGIGLRRRSGGGDEGWHLKLERVVGERIEVRRPLGRTGGQVPKALRDLVAALVRDRELASVARLQTHRRIHRIVAPTGATLAEIADDEVHGEALGSTASTWRELEAELVDGDGQLLEAVSHLIQEAGARPSATPSKLFHVLGPNLADERTPEVDGSSPAGDVFLAYLREHVTALVSVDPGVRVDIEDAVHKMRVATRRLRSAMATYRRLLDRSVTDPLRDELKWLAGVLSPVRDAEVIRDHLRRAVDEQPRALVVGPVRRRIDSSLDAQHRTAHDRALPELSSTRYFRLLDALDDVAGGSTLRGQRVARPARKVLAREIGRTHKRMRRILDEALASPGPEDRLLHEVRKAAKRVRYAAESGAPVFGSAATALAARMEEAQDILGAHQDSVVIRTVLRRLAGEADAAGEPSFTYGRLHGIEERRADEATATFLERVDDGLASPPSWLA